MQHLQSYNQLLAAGIIALDEELDCICSTDGEVTILLYIEDESLAEKVEEFDIDPVSNVLHVITVQGGYIVKENAPMFIAFSTFMPAAILA